MRFCPAAVACCGGMATGTKDALTSSCRRSCFCREGLAAQAAFLRSMPTHPGVSARCDSASGLHPVVRGERATEWGRPPLHRTLTTPACAAPLAPAVAWVNTSVADGSTTSSAAATFEFNGTDSTGVQFTCTLTAR